MRLSATLAHRAGRPEAAAAIWQWRGSATGPETGTGWRNPRVRGALQAAAALGAGTLVRLYGSHTLGALMLAAGGLVLLASLLSPTGLYAGIERALQAASGALGRAVSWLLLATVFYLFFTPYGWLFRSRKNDPMRRFYEPDAKTYWEARERGRSASESYDRQY